MLVLSVNQRSNSDGKEKQSDREPSSKKLFVILSQKNFQTPWQNDSSTAPSISVDLECLHCVQFVNPKLLEKVPIGHKEHTGVPSADQ